MLNRPFSGSVRHGHKGPGEKIVCAAHATRKMANPHLNRICCE